MSSFELRVVFSGLCLHVIHPKRKEVAVVLPDARRGKLVKHRDGARTTPHVGYLRADLASVALLDDRARIPVEKLTGEVSQDDGPHFEIVYRFKGQTLDFGLDESTKQTVKPGLPDFKAFAPQLTLNKGIFVKPQGKGATRPPVLLRTVLRGGNLSRPAGESKETWSMDGRFTQSGKPKVEGLHGDMIWTRTVDDPEERGLLLTLKSLDGRTPVHLPLRPVGQPARINLKIANLCAENPLEWNQLRLRTATLEDADFKWLYELFDAPGGDWEKYLGNQVLPAPRLVSREKAMGGSGAGNCAGGTTTANFPHFKDWT